MSRALSPFGHQMAIDGDSCALCGATRYAIEDGLAPHCDPTQFFARTMADQRAWLNSYERELNQRQSQAEEILATIAIERDLLRQCRESLPE